ncbi:ABC transporter ATP-binding protein [Polynucleobacter sp. AP-Capit-er-40B-B4]|uniref:ABC transporter ATP-binding protein n=1 Tax=Polynucleobacter sp. AP-Capit-er-40B-B4 TaxID=2576927 RepID=UPI001C0BC3A2|nr:ABC transporter ATP-binding protein [Polynucleobacter sp. AP-Capit-er-40B-B4]MBU3580983.1 ABC transporter ATP-binding protein [Polynucleobacter sp. AP-Capit-er-40B-B4]
MTSKKIGLREIVLSVWELLDHRERKLAQIFIAMSILATLLEMLSLGIVVPLLYAFSASAQSQNTGLFGIFMSLSFIRDLTLFHTLLLLVILFSLKNIFLLFLARFQAKYVFGIEEALSNRIYQIYLYQPYSFFLQHNSAQLLRNIMREPSQFAHNSLSPLCSLVTEFFISVGIVSLLILVNPLGTITSLALFGVVGYFFYVFAHQRISLWGRDHQFHEGRRLQNLQEGFGSIKEILIGALQDKFTAAYAEHMRAGSLAGINQQSIQSAPRLFIELFAVVVLSISIWFFSHLDPAMLLPIIGLYAASAFRLMPGINRIINSLQSLRYSASTVQLLKKELTLDVKTHIRKGAPIHFKKNINLEKISFSFNKNARILFNDANVIIKKGDVVFLSGPSGSGKTTLVDIICGLQQPTSGRVLVDGADISGDIASWQKHIAYVHQTTFLLDGTIKENIIFSTSKEAIDEDRLREVCRISGVNEIVHSLPGGIDTRVGERGSNLSGGQRQRIGLARALYRGGDLLILDEATNALDAKLEAEIVRNILGFTSGMTKIWITHNVNLLNNTQNIYVGDGSIRKI